jgi:hypothetical protein
MDIVRHKDCDGVIRKAFTPGKSPLTLFSSRETFALTEVEKREIERDGGAKFLNYLTMRGKLA